MTRESVWRGRFVFEDDVMVFPPPDVLPSRLVPPNAAAHPEGDQKRLTAVEIRHDVLPPPPQPLHSSTCQPTFEILRKRSAKIAAAGFHRGQPASFHSRLEASLDGFDFGQFRHEAILAVLCYAGLRRIVRNHEPYQAEGSRGQKARRAGS